MTQIQFDYIVDISSIGSLLNMSARFVVD